MSDNNNVTLLKEMLSVCSHTSAPVNNKYFTHKKNPIVGKYT